MTHPIRAVGRGLPIPPVFRHSSWRLPAGAKHPFILTLFLMMGVPMLHAATVLPPAEATGPAKGALTDQRDAIVLDASAPLGAEAKWALAEPLAPGWHGIAIDFTAGAPGNRKMWSLELGDGSPKVILTIDLYYAPDRGPEGKEPLLAIYIPQTVTTVTLRKNQKRTSPATPILKLTLTPGRPPFSKTFMESARVPVEDGKLALPDGVGDGLFRALASKPLGFKWTQGDGLSFTTPPSFATSLFVAGNLVGGETIGDSTNFIFLERRPDVASPVDSNYMNRPLLALAGPGVETLEVRITGTNLDPTKVTLADYPNGARMAAVQSWDDGIDGDLRMAVLLEKHGWKASFFFNKHSRILDKWNEIEGHGQEVGAHSWSHPAYWLQSPRRCFEESYGIRTLLEEKTGHPVISYGYPFNYGAAWDAKGDYVRRANADAGYLSCRATSTGQTTLDNMGDPLIYKSDGHFLMPPDRFKALWDRAAATNRGVFYIWGHTYELPKEGDWTEFENRMAEYGRHPEAWYASQGDLSVWKWMRDNTKITANLQGNDLIVKLERPSLHRFWAKRVPVALSCPGASSATAGGKTVTHWNGGLQVGWE